MWEDIRDDFAGHGICAPQAWIHGTAGLLGAYHPTATGHRLGYTPALTAATARLTP